MNLLSVVFCQGLKLKLEIKSWIENQDRDMVIGAGRAQVY